MTKMRSTEFILVAAYCVSSKDSSNLREARFYKDLLGLTHSLPLPAAIRVPILGKTKRQAKSVFLSNE